jgi:N-acetylglucosamine-6-phosphate deacetylase
MSRCVLAGADLVLPDRVAANHTLVIEDGRIVDITGPLSGTRAGDRRVDLTGHLIVPGFVDVHVHGVGGHDVQDGPGAIARVASLLPRYGVTACCPTTVACDVPVLLDVLAEVRSLREAPAAGAARVLPAHLESNFINQDYRGAQPMRCLRVPPAATAGARGAAWEGDDILSAVLSAAPDVGIMTLAPELPNGLDLVRAVRAAGIIVSLGHSGADYETAMAAIAAGASQATHLFNRMTPMTHRDPGLTGAVLTSDDVAAELICDGVHVHPAVMRLAIRAKSPSRIMAITDGTAGSGLPRGARARLGGQEITVEDVARLDDGTIAGSVLTMDRAFAGLVGRAGAGLVEAARMCATTPARELGLSGHGVLAPGSVADLAVLDASLTVRQTWISGAPVWTAEAPAGAIA